MIDALATPHAGLALPLYSANDLALRYGEILALALPSLELAKGEALALVGPNGSGKTTLLKILAGLLRPSSGGILFEGESAETSIRLRARVVYLHQQPYMLAGSVAYNVEFGARARGSAPAAAAAKASAALEELGLGGYGRRRHRALSGGEAQRVALARAFATGADVILLDEPTASADSASRDRILDCVRGRIASGYTVVFSTHDAGVAGELAHRVISMESGRVTEDRRTSDAL